MDQTTIINAQRAQMDQYLNDEYTKLIKLLASKPSPKKSQTPPPDITHIKRSIQDKAEAVSKLQTKIKLIDEKICEAVSTLKEELKEFEDEKLSDIKELREIHRKRERKIEIDYKREEKSLADVLRQAKALQEASNAH